MSRRNNKKKSLDIKNKKKIAIMVIIIILLIMFISVIFSLLNMGNTKFALGVKIENVDISNLTREEASQRVKDWYNDIVLKDINLVYENMRETINVKQLGIETDIDKVINQAYLIGRSGNILIDNYEILSSMIFHKKYNLEINLSEEKVTQKIEELNSKLPDALIDSSYYIEESNLVIKKGNAGLQIKEEEFKDKINEKIKNEDRQIIVPVKEVLPKKIDIEQIYNEIYKEAKDAYISENPITVHPDVKGINFAISKDEAKRMLEEDKDEYIIPLNITIPNMTLDKLGKEAFPSKLGSFTTKYNMDNENRNTNLTLASNKVNGTIILPGETFSYNKIVGERTISKGYKEAAVYEGGKVVKGIGGGICQLSTTLYNAVLYANLDITSRSNHRFITSYVTPGRDATVSWGTIDLCFKNTRNYPIKIVSIVKNGIATVEIYGMQEEKEYEVVIENTLTEVIPYTTNYIKDSNLEKGTEEIKQYGANGVKSETYKILKYNGIIVSRSLLSKDNYSPLEEIIRKGTK